MSGSPAADIPEKNRSTASRRLRGIDVARAIAVLGMVMVHFGPDPVPDTALGNLYSLVSHGRASVLFALLAGVGVALLVANRSRGGLSLARGQLVLRGALLLPLGLWLQGLDHNALVILQYYAIYFLFVVLVLGLPDRWLLVGGVTVLVGGPLVYLWAKMVAPGWFPIGDPTSLDDPIGRIARDVLLTGAYPLVTWAAVLLFGLWIGRRNLAAAPVRWRLLVLGLAVAVAAALAADGLAAAFGETLEDPGEPGFADLLTDEAHSQMPLWLLGSTGSACAALGGMLLLADRLPRATWPLAATGQLGLTVYVGHLLLLGFYPELVKREAVPAASFTVGAFMLLAAAACTLWRAVLPRGPLEAALAAPWRIIERPFRRVGRRSATGRGTRGVAAAAALLLAAVVTLAATYTGSGDDYKIGRNITDGFDVDGGNDTAQGRGGKDLLKVGSGHDLALGGDDTDKYYGSDDDDVLSEYDWWGLPETDCTSISSDSSACTGGDAMYGGDGDDYLEGANGGDYLYGEAGVDHVFGDPDPDAIRGGAGADYLYGEQGSDNIKGGTGDDEMVGGSGSDTLRGHSGADTIDAEDGEVDYVYCGDDGDLDTVYADEIDKIDFSCRNDDVNKASAAGAAAAEGGANADNRQEQLRDERLADRLRQ